ncbi:hypothetical protein N836_29415 [Leptolyngbya sp. Heron Island J]|uniref:hypothetical protein n=1 Tax=Leptolyngbya sp. Heron Island J TaxID=1385935 RepID=UPI0003B9BB09|nr:hypothetical protein [Leptolyngbya sp. Heron Island J]ESA39075.1 hypothetical protein N836_29415 [Leptolyngbya sp. Heron Island J]
MKILFKPVLWFCVATLLLVGLWLRPVKASPALLDPRLNRLESQVRSLQSQVNRLQSQIPRAGGRQPVTDNTPPAPDEPSLDQQFDTLAILIIELQERVSTLEARLDEITTDS